MIIGQAVKYQLVPLDVVFIKVIHYSMRRLWYIMHLAIAANKHNLLFVRLQVQFRGGRGLPVLSLPLLDKVSDLFLQILQKAFGSLCLLELLAEFFRDFAVASHSCRALALVLPPRGLGAFSGCHLGIPQRSQIVRHGALPIRRLNLPVRRQRRLRPRIAQETV